MSQCEIAVDRALNFAREGRRGHAQVAWHRAEQFRISAEECAAALAENAPGSAGAVSLQRQLETTRLTYDTVRAYVLGRVAA